MSLFSAQVPLFHHMFVSQRAILKQALLCLIPTPQWLCEFEYARGSTFYLWLRSVLIVALSWLDYNCSKMYAYMRPILEAQKSYNLNETISRSYPIFKELCQQIYKSNHCPEQYIKKI